MRSTWDRTNTTCRRRSTSSRVPFSDTLEGVIDGGVDIDGLFGSGAEGSMRDIESILILASGTSYYAGLVGRYWIEGIAKVPVNVELGHEYRYRESIPNPKQLVVTISQSGETLDTMEALKRAKELGHEATLSICNVRESAISRASRFVFYTRAGQEIGVASTKAFTTQLVSLYVLALAVASAKGRLTSGAEARALQQLRFVPGSIQYALNLEPQIQVWAERFATREHALFLGRGIHYRVALEGALKLKEISYIHAEAYPAGELKHGPLALVDSQMPVVVIAPNDSLLEKVKSNMQEVRAARRRTLRLRRPRQPLHRERGRARDPHAPPCRRPVSHRPRDPRAAPRVSHGLAARHRRRQAPQPREGRHGRVALASPRRPRPGG